MGRQQEETTQLYSSEDLLAFKPPFKKYSREAVLHFLVHELKCISIDEDYAVTIDMDLFPTNEKRENYYLLKNLYSIVSVLKVYGYTIFFNIEAIREYIQHYQFDSGFFGGGRKKPTLAATVTCISLLDKLGQSVPKKDEVISYIHNSEMAEGNNYPAILNIQLPGATRPELCFSTGAATINELSLILHLCNSEWKDIEEKFEWIESTWEDGIGYKMVRLQKDFFSQPPHIIPQQSTFSVIKLHNRYNREVLRSRDIIRIFETNNDISDFDILSLYHSLSLASPRSIKKKNYQNILKSWDSETGGFFPVAMPVSLTRNVEPLKPTLQATLSNSMKLEEYFS